MCNKPFLIVLLGLVVISVSASGQTPNWIWSKANPGEDDVLYFRKSFELPEKIEGVKVAFWGTCDNVLNVNVNGQAVGFSTEWPRPMFHDITKFVKPGRNVVVIKATNQGSFAGLIARVTITSAAGKSRAVMTDETWKWIDVTNLDKNDPLHKAVVLNDFD